MKNTLLEAVNKFPQLAKNALENVYRGKVYAVGMANGHIDHFFKTKRGAEGFINKKSRVVYYDEYTREMVTCGSGLFIEEIQESDILDYKTNKKIWYNVLKEYNGHNFMYDNILHWVNRFGVSTEIVEYVTTTVEELKQYKGLSVIDEYENEKHFEHAEETAEIETVETVTIETEQNKQIQLIEQKNVTYRLNSELNGIEITFAEKPLGEVIAQLKSNGYRWSNRGYWYAKQTPERISFAEQLTGSNETEQVETEQFSYPGIDIEDIESYTVSKELQAAEHNASWIFRNGEKDRTQEIQDHFTHYNELVKNVLSNTNNEQIIYRLKKSLQYYKKNYFENYIAQLRHRASNPSWAVTGRSGRNASRDAKASGREDKLIRESIELTEQIKSAIDKAKRAIRLNNESKIRQQMSNTNVDIEFKVESKTITLHGLTEKVRAYVYQDYMICRTWGCFRIFHNGKEIHSMKTTDKLDHAKKYVTMLFQQEKAV